MNDLELLDLIKKGETEDILLQKDLTARLNILTAKGLVEISAGKIIITPMGDQFQKEQKVDTGHQSRLQKEMDEFSRDSFKRNSIYVYLCFALSCTAAILLLIMVLNGV